MAVSTFGDRLREFRETSGLTQTQLGDAVGVSLMTIIRYEGNRRLPTWDVVLKLCEALGKRPNDFAPTPSRRGKKK